MGNQTLVPSQIQTVESYFLDLKNFVQFKSSLGSTTFMKTAKVNLIENLIYDEFMAAQNSYMSDQSGNHQASHNQSNAHSSNNEMNLHQPHHQGSNSNQNNSGINNQSTSHQSNSANLANKITQLQLFKARIQELRELQQQVVVKIFPKYDLSIRLDLYSKRVREIKNIIYSTYGLYTNCLPFSELIITDRAAFLFRQYVKYNLYDRISTRPFLTHIEKKWIAFQLICAVNEIHSLQIVHGDIKTENVLVNSFLWVSLADFASYKPVYLSKNHPSADFNYYFDISRRRTCYLAPERLDSTRDLSSPPASTDMIVNEVMPPDPNEFKASMDIFSLGCVIAELFMERPLFDFAHLLAYRDNKYDPYNDIVNEIRGDKPLLDMILSMLSLDPNKRKTANEYLQDQNDKSFPSYFVYLKNYIKGFISVRLTPDEIAIRLKNDLPLLLKNFKLNLNSDNQDNDGMQAIENLLAKSTLNQPSSKPSLTTNTNDAFLILLSLLLSSIRKIKFAENKLIAIDLMTHFSKFLDDSVILDRILPYYIILVDENNSNPEQQQSANVKAHVIYSLNDCLSNIYQLDLQNMNIFPEIIFVILESLSRDESFLVRSAVAKTISNFALTSLRYLDTSFLIKRSLLNENQQESGTNSSQHEKIDQKTTEDSKKFASYDKEYEHYQNRVTEIVMQLITDINPNATSSNSIKETLIRSDISKLCSFFSRQKTSEFLLPHMITILNEKTDWSVRAAFFDALCPVLSCIGWESVEIVKSLLEQGLRDSEEFVIHRTLNTLSKMVEIGLLERQQIFYFLKNHITALLCHPSLWIRHGAVNFVTVVCKQNVNKTGDDYQMNQFINGLNTADILCSVAPLLNKVLQRKDLINYDREEILFNCLKKPIKREVYDCISQDGRSDQLFCYLNQRSEIRCLTNQNYLPGYVDCSDSNVQKFFEKLCSFGLIEEDEDKLLHMKDFIEKTRISRLSSSLHNADNMISSSTSLGTTNKFDQISNSPWASNMKENFMTKDGYITIMKDKFQRCNIEYLNSRKITGFVSPSIDHQPENSNLDQSNSTKPELDSSDTINAEWKLMFGHTRPVVEESPNTGSKSTTTKSRSKQDQNSSSNNTYYNLNQNLSQLMSFKNCTVEVEKFLNRSKLIYEDHKLKRFKCERAKETINSSISSNIISLSSSNQRWRPKGLLVAHSNEHTKEITRISRNFDSSYFSTCSATECSVKIWSTESLLDGKSGFFKSIFTYDKQTSITSPPTNDSATSIQPNCTAFYDKTSLAILGEDFRFHVIDFNSNRTQYHLYTHERLFKPNICTQHKRNLKAQTKTSFYYLNKSFKNYQFTKCLNPKGYYCSNNYPIEMIYIDDSAPTWPLAATNLGEYFKTTIGSSTKGLFCYSTSVGDVSCIDLRTRSKVFDMRRDLRKGYITSMVTDPWHTWLALGTSYGSIELYDFRYMLPVETFEHRSKTAVTKLCNHPLSPSRICASYQGNNEVAIWNMNTSNSNKNQSTRRFANTNEAEFVFWGVQSVPPLCQNKISSYYISGLIGCSSGPEEAGIMCASTDMKIRYIDLNETNQMRDSFIVSSPFQNIKTAKSNPSNLEQSPTSKLNSNFAEFGNGNLQNSKNVTYEVRQIEGTKVMVEIDQSNNSQQFNLNTNLNSTAQALSYNSPALTHQSQFTHHQDAISDLTICYNHFNSKNTPLIITSARDGALKIWK